jgi:predicted secreted protein
MSINGNLVILSVWNKVDAYEPLACLTSNTLSETTNIIESQTKCYADEIRKQSGTYSYELSAEGECIDTTSVSGMSSKASYDKLRGYQGDTLNWKMSTGLQDTPSYYGTAIISDLEQTADAADAFLTFSISLSGSGIIVETDPLV